MSRTWGSRPRVQHLVEFEGRSPCLRQNQMLGAELGNQCWIFGALENLPLEKVERSEISVNFVALSSAANDGAAACSINVCPPEPSTIVRILPLPRVSDFEHRRLLLRRQHATLRSHFTAPARQIVVAPLNDPSRLHRAPYATRRFGSRSDTRSMTRFQVVRKSFHVGDHALFTSVNHHWPSFEGEPRRPRHGLEREAGRAAARRLEASKRAVLREPLL
jgi:hypothetical protein